MGRRTFINIELKNHRSHGEDLVETVCMLVKKHQMQKYVMFSSFFPLRFRRRTIICPTCRAGCWP